MQNRNEIRKRANRHFLIKVVINTLLIVVGAVFITLFLSKMQHETTLSRQRQNSEMALSEAVSLLEENARNTQTVSELYHDGNQVMLDDLQDLLLSGVYGPLTSSGRKDRCEVFRDLAECSEVDALFLLGPDGRVLFSPSPWYYQKSLTELGLMSAENAEKLLEGTRTADDSVLPVVEEKENGRVYFYSVKLSSGGQEDLLVLSVNAEARGDGGIDAMAKDDLILGQASVSNNGFMFAVNPEDGSFLFYQHGAEVLTGLNSYEAGLSTDALQDGYDGIQTINGTEYYCVSKALENGTVVCAAADTDRIFYNDRHALKWSIATFLAVMFLCLSYTIIVRNDYIRTAVETKKIDLYRWLGSTVNFDITIFRKVFPLMLTGVLLIFGMSYFTQTMMAISQTAEKSAAALDTAYERYHSGIESLLVIQESHDSRFIAKARLIARMLEEDPSVLNEPSDRFYSSLNDDGVREYCPDDEGNRLRSVSLAARLQELCEMNDLDSVYILNESGRTIATNTENWYFTLSLDPADPSWPFLKVLDGRKDVMIRSLRPVDSSEFEQMIGVAFNYYTALDGEGNTVYLPRREYMEQSSREDLSQITAHRSLLLVGSEDDRGDLNPAKTESILSLDVLSDGSLLLFDKEEDHICLYSDVEENIGMKASEMNVPKNAFTPGVYYGFHRVNGVPSFLYSDYRGGENIISLIPRSEMYQDRARITLNTALTSLLLILLISVIVTLTSEEEELLYSTRDEGAEEGGLKSALLNFLLPRGNQQPATGAAGRWSRHGTPWAHKTPEQKLSWIINTGFMVLVVYVIIAIVGAETFFPKHTVIRYILSGAWERGFNIFAFTACVLVILAVKILVALLRIPLLSMSSLLGTRSETIGNLMLSVVKYSGAIATFFFCLYLVGMNPTSLLASAGVLSLIIGLGAQSLIKDILAGIFFVFEGEFRIGDIVTIDGFRGTVMDIGLRTTKILGIDGNIKIFNNSEISGVLNMTQESSFMFCPISIEYGQDIDYVEAVLRRDLPKLREKNPHILSDPVCVGVDKLADSGVELMIRVECHEEDILSVRRYVNKEILKIFYCNSIPVPFPNVTVSTLDTKDRKTIADYQDLDPDALTWWDAAHTTTRKITVTSLGVGMEDALLITEQLATLNGLKHRSMLHLRLLTEELFGLLRSIAGDVTASYWIVVKENTYELHMRTHLQMTPEMRDQFLSVSTSGENAAAKSFMARLRDMMYAKLFKSADDLELSHEHVRRMTSDRNSAEDWTMSQYMSDIDSLREQSTDAAAQWDELEKSIVARLADEVKVSMRGISAEIIIIKIFSEG